MDFYIYLNGSKRGPFSEERLRELLAEGVLQPQDLASGPNDPDWKPLGEFRRFATADVQSSVPPPIVELPVAQPVPQRPMEAVSASGAPGARSPEGRSAILPNESACFRTSLHWIIFVRYGLIAAALFLFAAIPLVVALQAVTGLEIGWFALPFPLCVLVAPVVAFVSSELVVTERRIVIKAGVVRRQTVEMPLEKVESIAVDQGFFGRMFDYGTVTIRGTGGLAESFETIARPITLRQWIQRLQSGDPHRSEPLQPAKR